jgi:hypothetical protein
MKVLLMLMILVLGQINDRNQTTGLGNNNTGEPFPVAGEGLRMSGSGSRRAISSYGCGKSEHPVHVGQSTRLFDLGHAW